MEENPSLSLDPRITIHDSRITVLPQEVISKIAAGEVIERPASALKELLENSMDAGASKIEVEIENAGKGLLRVVDDGHGMPPGDCRQAFARHATSKIRDLSDLETLGTYGFRGEALFSIAAVSETTLTSCPPGAREGFSLTVEAGRILKERRAPPVPGTALEVRRLFFNTPARAKFLKSAPAEKSQLLRVVEEASLSHPREQFVLKQDGRQSFHLTPQPSLSPESYRERARDLLGKTAEDLVLVSIHRSDLRLTAFISQPDALVSSRQQQYFFVNRRPIASRLLQQALYRGYEAYRPRHKHPACILFLELPPSQFDVNVHPQKKEVRFRSEHDLFQFLQSALQNGLLKSKQPLPLSASRSQFALAPAPPSNQNLSARLSGPSDGTAVREPSPTYTAPAEPPFLEGAEPGPSWYTPPFRYLGQIEKTYLVYECRGGLLLLDQHAGQERIFFERYLEEFKNGGPAAQRLMIPIPVDLSPSQIQKVLSWRDELKECGFDLSPFGKNSILVHALPHLFDLGPAEMKDLLENLTDSPGGPDPAESRREAIATTACKKAVKAHDRLGQEEALRLLEDLKRCRDPLACPHGRPTLLKMSRDELARRFKRPGPPPL